MTRGDALAALETRLGHAFKDRALLTRALTHSSTLPRDRVAGRDLERLEFLGDRVLGLMTAEALWRAFPDEDEGGLAVRLNALVRKETCADVAREMELGPLIQLSKSEESGGGRRKTTILGDVCEAVLAALYLDGGMSAAEAVFERYWRKRVAAPAFSRKDAKTELQEWAQGAGKAAPEYATLSQAGPDHAPNFEIEVRVNGLAPARAEGASKRGAQQAAAEAMLRREGVWTGGPHG